LSGAK